MASPCSFSRADFLQDTQILADADVCFIYATKMPVDTTTGKLLLSRPLRSVLKTGSTVVTVNRELQVDSGYELLEELKGPNPEIPGQCSIAFVYRVI